LVQLLGIQRGVGLKADLGSSLERETGGYCVHQHSAFWPHSVSMCLEQIAEYRAIVSLYSIN